MCSRMLIMYGGKILAADTPENLQKLVHGISRIVAEINAPEGELREALSRISGVAGLEMAAGRDGFQRCVLTPLDGVDLRPVLFMLALERGWVLRELTRSRQSLEDIYVQVTKPGEEEEN